ncbi:MAG: DUF927 domain-containing protein, partial [Gammaproteobacteria bacterium SHHR-1]
WVCSPLRVTAVTRSLSNEGWGRLLEFDDLDGQPHQWAMPLALLSGDGAEVRRILLDQGLRISPVQRSRNLLNQFLQTAAPAARCLATEKTGWVGGCFVLPDATIGQTDQRILLQTGGTRISGYGCAGSLDGWRKQVAVHCTGNSRLILAVAAAFAAPLLHICDAEPGGFHLRGASSLGKSTAMLVAASVWGGHDRLRRWRATDNSLEVVACENNDALLLLDELKEADPKTLGQSIYMLAHGAGKVRLSRDATARPILTWRVLLVSSGEIGLADHVEAAGQRFNAGMEARVVDVPADAGQGFGLFDTLHHFTSGGDLARHLTEASKRHHGHAARAFIEKVAQDPDAIKTRWTQARDALVAAMVGQQDAAGMVYRVASRFALCAFAGELASEWGITGWQPGEATRGVTTTFGAWLNARGGYGASEDMDSLRCVRDFIQAHGEARFVPTDVPDQKQLRTIHRAGCVDFRDGEPFYFIFTGTFRGEVCKGMDYRAVARILKERGHLLCDGDRLTTKSPRLHDGSRHRAYCVKASILDDDLIL